MPKARRVTLPRGLDLKVLAEKNSLTSREIAAVLQTDPKRVPRMLRGDESVLYENVPPLAALFAQRCRNQELEREIREGVVGYDVTGVDHDSGREFMRFRRRVIDEFSGRMQDLTKSHRRFECEVLIYDGKLIKDILTDRGVLQSSSIAIGDSALTKIRTVRMRDRSLRLLKQMGMVRDDLPDAVARNMKLIDAVKSGRSQTPVSVVHEARFYDGLPEAFAVHIPGLIAFGEPMVAEDGTFRTPPKLDLWSESKFPGRYQAAVKRLNEIFSRSKPESNDPM